MKKRILLVEDDKYIREMYALVLGNAGYEVKEASDGAVGLVEAIEGGYDVILLDLMMPNMDGMAFLKELNKSSVKTPNGDIIILSNLAYGDARKETEELGADGFLVKADLDPKDVVKIVNESAKGKPKTAKEAIERDKEE